VVAHEEADDERDGGRDRITQGVGQQRARQRSDACDRQRPEAVEHTLVHVFAHCVPVTTEVVMTVCTRMPGINAGR
jgi:hypothetical protein